MRRFLIFLGSGLVLIAIVFVYAQSKRDEVYTVPYPEMSVPQTGKVLSAQTNPDTKTPSASLLPVKLLIDKQPVYLYWTQKITIETTPGAEVKIRVTYPNGSMNNSGSQTGIADNKGQYLVKWDIRGKDMIGIAKVKVSVSLGEKQGSAEGEFEITQYSKATNTPVPSATANP